AKAALDGILRQQGSMGIDVGAQEEAPVEPALEEPAQAPAQDGEASA
ncbi:MAG: 30S ribosomal protein S2, partial [Pyrinomonadaceae bacterium]